MTSVLLIYPFFIPPRDRSIFRFPPLGLAYLAASLQKAGHGVQLLDCTFLTRKNAEEIALEAKVEVVGIYCMVTMMEDCLWFSRLMRPRCKLLIAGGPLPTCDPQSFIEHFDAVILGEGEQTLLDLLDVYAQGLDLSIVPGIAYKSFSSEKKQWDMFTTAVRRFESILDRNPFPARNLLPNADYIRYGKRKYGYSITTVMSTRGCPYRCEFCSNVVFGGSYRERSAENVVDEVEEALLLGYDRISFADDVFTLNRGRVQTICAEIGQRKLHFQWECLGRVDSMDETTALAMKQAGCTRIYFGIESGNSEILTLMQKKITVNQARQAVETARHAGLETGAFFILFYPGDTNESVLETLHFATSLPLDYLGLSMPYPLPGTALHERVRNLVRREWRPGESVFGSHVLIYKSEFSVPKIWFGIMKGHAQFKLNKWLGQYAPQLVKFFENITDTLLRRMK